MKKVRLTLMTALLLSVSGLIKAAMGTVSPYTATFDNVTPSQQGWLVDTSWGHIIDTTNGQTAYALNTSSVMISYGNYAKVLQIGAQNGNTDVLVTPRVKGKVTLKAKRSGYNPGSMKFYKVTKKDDGYTLGELIKEVANTELKDMSTTGANAFTDITIADDADGYIGIWGENVFIDDFTATSAEVELKPALTVQSFSKVNTYADVDADGKFTVTFKVTVKNTGNIDLTTADGNYSVTLKKDGQPVAASTTAVPVDLAVGHTSGAFNVTATFDYEGNEAEATYQVTENMTGTTFNAAVKVKPTPYQPLMKLTKGTTATAVTSADTQDFGLAAAGATMTYTLSNEGAKALSISAAAFATGAFTTDLAAPLTVAAHDKKTVSVTLAATEGTPADVLTIDSDGGTLAIPFKATVLDASKYFEGFESGKFADDFDLSQNKDEDGDPAWSVISMPGYGMGGNSSKKIARAGSYGDATSRIITPLLESDGTRLTFDAASTPYASGYLLVIAYSADKQTWTELRTYDNTGLSTDFKQVGVTVPAGNYYVAFSGKKVNIDNIYGYKLATSAVRQWAVTEVSVPAKTKVGLETTVSARLKNNGTTDEEAGSYTATLYVGGKAVATAEAVALAKGATADYTFSFTPAEAGDAKAYVEFKKGDYSASSEPCDISIADAGEVMEQTAQVGEGTTNSSSIVFTQNSTYNEFIAVYPQSMMSGVTAGSSLTKLTFRIANVAERNNKFTVYLANSDDETLAKPASETPDVTAMTKVFEGSSIVPAGGDDEEDEYIDWTIGFTTPFTYTGKALRLVVFEEKGEASNGGVYFCRTATQNAYARNSNYEGFVSPYGYAASFSLKYLPVMVLTYKPGAAATGLSVTIAESGYSTLSATEALDFAAATTATEGAAPLQAYIATAATATAVSIEPVTAVPAATGVIVKGTPGAVYTIPFTATATIASAGLLKPAATLTGDGTEYILVGGVFHRAKAGTLAEGKAYLKLPAAGARTLTISEGAQATAVATPAADGDTAPAYSLSGVRTDRPLKGLYIKNGKKYIAK